MLLAEHSEEILPIDLPQSWKPLLAQGANLRYALSFPGP